MPLPSTPANARIVLSLPAWVKAQIQAVASVTDKPLNRVLLDCFQNQFGAVDPVTIERRKDGTFTLRVLDTASGVYRIAADAVGEADAGEQANALRIAWVRRWLAAKQAFQ